MAAANHLETGERVATRARDADRGRKFLAGLKSLRLAEVLSRHEVAGVGVEHMVATAAIHRAGRLISARVETALASLDLTTPRYEILALLSTSETGELGFGDLKKALLLHAATMTYTVDNLVERKMIRRKQDASDRRALRAEITASGRALAAKATEALAEIHFGLEELSDAEALEVATLLLKLRRV
jgi:DNA-binding MarR family transcriptional regulator